MEGIGREMRVGEFRRIDRSIDGPSYSISHEFVVQVGYRMVEKLRVDYEVVRRNTRVNAYSMNHGIVRLTKSRLEKQLFMSKKNRDVRLPGRCGRGRDDR